MNFVNIDYEKFDISTKNKKKKTKKTKKINHPHIKEEGYLLWSLGDGKFIFSSVNFCNICGNIISTKRLDEYTININSTNEEILMAINFTKESTKIFKTYKSSWSIKNMFEDCEFVGLSHKEKASEN